MAETARAFLWTILAFAVGIAIAASLTPGPQPVEESTPAPGTADNTTSPENETSPQNATSSDNATPSDNATIDGATEPAANVSTNVTAE